MLVYAGIQWIPERKPRPPVPEPLEIAAPVLPVVFKEKGPLDLNKATAAELEKLPGIGPVLAARIVSWREAHGPFQSVEDLLAVPGIGPKVLEGLRDKVTVKPP